MSTRRPLVVLRSLLDTPAESESIAQAIVAGLAWLAGVVVLCAAFWLAAVATGRAS